MNNDTEDFALPSLGLSLVAADGQCLCLALAEIIVAKFVGNLPGTRTDIAGPAFDTFVILAHGTTHFLCSHIQHERMTGARHLLKNGNM